MPSGDEVRYRCARELAVGDVPLEMGESGESGESQTDCAGLKCDQVLLNDWEDRAETRLAACGDCGLHDPASDLSLWITKEDAWLHEPRLWPCGCLEAG